MFSPCFPRSLIGFQPSDIQHAWGGGYVNRHCSRVTRYAETSVAMWVATMARVEAWFELGIPRFRRREHGSQ